ncbi:hypothetical protein N2152v2_005523 [Parachlorella kessleri]
MCSYFQAPMTGVKDNAGASAVFEGMTHSGVMYWALNVTDVVGLSGAKVVYGNASLSSEAVVNYLALEEPLDGTFFWEGEFVAGNFTAEYPWTMNGLSANIGLGHIWLALSNTAEWSNTILWGQLQQKSGAQLYWGDRLSERAEMAEMDM